MAMGDRGHGLLHGVYWRDHPSYRFGTLYGGVETFIGSYSTYE